MSQAVKRWTVIPYQLPLVPPVLTSHGDFHERAGWWIELTDAHGRTGTGDAAPWPGFGHGRSPEEDLRLGAEALSGERFATPGDVGRAVSDLALGPEAANALSQALLDLLGQRLGLSLAKLLQPNAREAVTTHVLVGDAAEAQRAVQGGVSTLKIKAGADVGEVDLRLERIRQAVGFGVAIRLDVNGGWAVADAEANIEQLARHRLEWIEQPVSVGEIDALATLRQGSSIRLALDESVRDRRSLEVLLEREAVDVVVLKPMFLGGPLQAMELARLANGRGIDVCVTHALESVVGRLGALHVAAAVAALPGQDVAAGIAGGPGGEGNGYPQAVGGRVPVPASPGLGSRGAREAA